MINGRQIHVKTLAYSAKREKDFCGYLRCFSELMFTLVFAYIAGMELMITSWQ